MQFWICFFAQKKGASEEAHVRIKDILVYPGTANTCIISLFQSAVNMKRLFLLPVFRRSVRLAKCAVMRFAVI